MKKRCPRQLLLRILWEIVSTVVPAVFVALFVNVYVVQATVIEGPSMQPNLYYDQLDPGLAAIEIIDHGADGYAENANEAVGV